MRTVAACVAVCVSIVCFNLLQCAALENLLFVKSDLRFARRRQDHIEDCVMSHIVSSKSHISVSSKSYMILPSSPTHTATHAATVRISDTNVTD